MDDTMNQKEKVIGFIYVFLLFISITTVCCFLLFYYNSDFRGFTQKNFAVSKMDRIQEFQQIQSHTAVKIDSLYNKVKRFQPNVTAIYEENDIKFMVEELKNIYEQHILDYRYKSFLHISKFYSDWFDDKKDLWSKRDNIVRLRKNLSDCEIGLEKNKNELILSSKK
jgi:hypothetical protein